jgi:hypothetical protein
MTVRKYFVVLKHFYGASFGGAIMCICMESKDLARLQEIVSPVGRLSSPDSTQSSRHGIRRTTDTKLTPRLPCPCTTLDVTPHPSHCNRCAPAAQPSRSQDSVDLVAAHYYGLPWYAGRNAGVRTLWRWLYTASHPSPASTLYLQRLVKKVEVVEVRRLQPVLLAMSQCRDGQ